MQALPQDFDWNAVYGAVGVVSVVVTAATIYLKLFIKSELTAFKETIMSQIDHKFPQKEMVDLKIDGHERRISRIETRMELIKSQKEADDNK